jgi:hypothetical protein
MQFSRSRVGALACAITALALGPVAPALAFDCSNASRPVGVGLKAVLDLNGNPEWVSKSWLNQLANGKSPDALHGGVVGFDCNGDGVADAITYADPHGALPDTAVNNGSPDHGVVSLESTAPPSCQGG